MNKTELNTQLQELQAARPLTWGKVISLLKRQFDNWALHELTQQGYEEFKMAYMPVLMNIHPDGITNNELARKARVTKQAMSKVIKELIELDFVVTETDSHDKRSSIIHLTEKGKKLVIDARQKVCELDKEYEELLGKEEFAVLKEQLVTIIKCHDEKHGLVGCF
ncbi:winged helix DNA-binding protein [Chitinophagaceae bacterium LB-8]|uniref:Winged helix DNA-binding protein n=1 Tax=Paraflavisolibacter caeni TaxID=2982496 RepID=A0A9X3BGF0_9BACT|nr:MarR family transcriptional regulator [Paraflavisolibacter caeni]MCU7547642.1 winged helix DNA-binding protein [Paraflavisolibacter caeni]